MSIRNVTVFAGTVVQATAFTELVRQYARGEMTITMADLEDTAVSMLSQFAIDLAFHPDSVAEILEWKREMEDEK